MSDSYTIERWKSWQKRNSRKWADTPPDPKGELDNVATPKGYYYTWKFPLVRKWDIFIKQIWPISLSIPRPAAVHYIAGNKYKDVYWHRSHKDKIKFSYETSSPNARNIFLLCSYEASFSGENVRLCDDHWILTDGKWYWRVNHPEFDWDDNVAIFYIDDIPRGLAGVPGPADIHEALYRDSHTS